MKKKNSFKSKIPNILTYSRIIVIPIIMVLFLLPISNVISWTILGLYVYACITDFLDGYLARKFKVVSEIGRFLDPIADKLLVATILLFLCANGTISGINLIAAILILLREIFVSGLREFMGPKKIKIHVTKLAKWKTTFQMVALCFFIISGICIKVKFIAVALLWVATVMTVVTGYSYFKQSLKHMK